MEGAKEEERKKGRRSRRKGFENEEEKERENKKKRKKGNRGVLGTAYVELTEQLKTLGLQDNFTRSEATGVF